MSEQSRLNIANIVKTFRKSKGWSEGELAVASGVSREAIRRVEQGGNVTLDTLDAIGAALGVELY